MLKASDISFDEVWEEVKFIQSNCRQRCLTKDDVNNALSLRKNSVRQEVVMWGGFVPNCYGYKAYATKLILNYDGTFYCDRNSSCTRSFAVGNSVFERGPLFGLMLPSKCPRWFPKISDDGKLLEKVSKNKLIRIMFYNREYGNIIKKINKTFSKTVR